VVQWHGREKISSLFLTFLKSLVFDKGFFFSVVVGKQSFRFLGREKIVPMLPLETNFSSFWCGKKFFSFYL
jgi:hypothetical protein